MFFLSRVRRWWIDSTRQIFYYHDGTRWHRADPYRIGKEIERVHPEYLKTLDTFLEATDSVPPGPLREDLSTKKGQAADVMVRVAREVFALLPLTETEGVTDPEAIKVLIDYFKFMQDLAEDAGPFAT